MLTTPDPSNILSAHGTGHGPVRFTGAVNVTVDPPKPFTAAFQPSTMRNASPKPGSLWRNSEAPLSVFFLNRFLTISEQVSVIMMRDAIRSAGLSLQFRGMAVADLEHKWCV